MSSKPQASTADRSNVYEVSDYISVAPASDYVLVRHYRTGRRDGGEIINEPISSTEELLASMIRAFEGRCLHVDQGLRGIFKQHQDANDCAAAVSTHHGKRTEVLGSELFVYF